MTEETAVRLVAAIERLASLLEPIALAETARLTRTEDPELWGRSYATVTGAPNRVATDAEIAASLREREQQ